MPGQRPTSAQLPPRSYRRCVCAGIKDNSCSRATAVAPCSRPFSRRSVADRAFDSLSEPRHAESR